MILKNKQEAENETKCASRPRRVNQVNVADLDSQYDPDSEEEEGNYALARELKKVTTENSYRCN